MSSAEYAPADQVTQPRIRHVVLVSTQRGWYGGEVQARNLIQGLQTRGVTCSVCARQDGRFAAGIAELGLKVVTFPGSGRNPIAWVKIWQHLRQQPAEVIHFNDPHALVAGALPVLGRRLPVRIASRRVALPIRTAWRYRALADCLLCVSKATAALAVQSGVPRGMIRIVYDGVAPERVIGGQRQRGRKALGVAEHQRVILCLASLTEQKGHRFLLEAFSKIKQHHPHTVLVLAGDGPLRHLLQESASHLEITDAVRFVGYRTDIADLLQAADVVVQPSLMEGLCSTVIEAMLAGRPIVASAVGGIPELFEGVSQNAHPWLVPAGDSHALAKAIATVLDAPERAEHHALLLQKVALSRFTSDKMVENTLAVYQEMLSKRLPQKDPTKSS